MNTAVIANTTVMAGKIVRLFIFVVLILVAYGTENYPDMILLFNNALLGILMTILHQKLALFPMLYIFPNGGKSVGAALAEYSRDPENL